MLYLGIADHGRQGMDALQLPDLWGCTSGYAFLGRGKQKDKCLSLVCLFTISLRRYTGPTEGLHWVDTFLEETSQGQCVTRMAP
jgi:hypothetical protein